MNLHYTYLDLPDKFYVRQKPARARFPEVILFNRELSNQLEIVCTDEEIKNWFSGNVLPENTASFSQAYAGHQFGHFTMLGDGRAIVLGEHLTPDGELVDIQLKGSGRTPFSRGGDGRATLYSMLREYLISEAMFSLGIPTSRSLAVVTTGDTVMRQVPHKGAVLTRVAKSHIRVGTFEFATRFTGIDGLRELLNYAVERHDPDLSELPDSEKAASFLKRVCERQADLVVHWMRVGFIHGVMNTDNTGVAGETFDYGPCAFMNAYNLKTVFSSIDSFGRYSFGNQPRIMQWNLAVFASALMPLLSDDTEIAKKRAQEIVDDFARDFTQKWEQMMVSKIGFREAHPKAATLVEDLLDWMAENKADYTNTFRILGNENFPENSIYQNETFQNWITRWRKLLEDNNISEDEALKRMKKVNPAFIPRNHLVEQALEAASQDNNMQPFEELMDSLKEPYPEYSKLEDLQSVPGEYDSTYQTFCGT